MAGFTESLSSIGQFLGPFLGALILAGVWLGLHAMGPILITFGQTKVCPENDEPCAKQKKDTTIAGSLFTAVFLLVLWIMIYYNQVYVR